MDETQDAAPSSTEPVIETKQYSDGSSAIGVAPLPDLSPAQQDAAAGDAGNAAGGASEAGQLQEATSAGNAPGLSSGGDAGNVDAGTAPAGAATPAIAYPSASQPSAEVAQPGESAANLSSQPSAGSDASISAGDAGEPHAEELKDSGTPLPSNFTAAPAPAVEAGNAPGPVDSAETATSPEDALTAVVAVTAAAFSVDMLDKFESRTYPDGTTMKTVGALPEASPVSYPAPTAPAVDTPHGLLNAIEAYFTTALRSSRTDGHKMISQLRAQLPQD